MKFKLVESMKELDEEILNEDRWYRVDINPNININNTSYNHIYIWARDKNYNTQVNDIFTSASSGLHRGRGKEQSFNVPVVKALSSGAFTISRIAPITGFPPTGASNILSRNDRSLRKETHIHQEANLKTISGINNNVQTLIHHINGDEGDFTLSNLVGVFDTNGLGGKTGQTLLNIGHLSCHLSQATLGRIAPFTYTVPVIDYSTPTPTQYSCTIELK